MDVHDFSQLQLGQWVTRLGVTYKVKARWWFGGTTARLFGVEFRTLHQDENHDIFISTENAQWYATLREWGKGQSYG